MYESLRDPFKWKYSNIVQNPLRTPDILSDELRFSSLVATGLVGNLGHAHRKLDESSCCCLVGGLEHVLFFHILGIFSSHLTFILFKGE